MYVFPNRFQLYAVRVCFTFRLHLISNIFRIATFVSSDETPHAVERLRVSDSGHPSQQAYQSQPNLRTMKPRIRNHQSVWTHPGTTAATVVGGQRLAY
jgi:hypothetical protein